MPTRAQIVAAARGWLGTPYRHQASLKGVGCDCLGLVRGVYRELYGTAPEAPSAYAPDWAEAGGCERLARGLARYFAPLPADRFLVGDVLVLRWRAHLPAKHAAIVSAPARLIHVHDGLAVTEVALVPAWRRRIAFAFSFPEVTD